jgi:hypothetical protein
MILAIHIAQCILYIGILLNNKWNSKQIKYEVSKVEQRIYLSVNFLPIFVFHRKVNGSKKKKLKKSQMFFNGNRIMHS